MNKNTTDKSLHFIKLVTGEAFLSNDEETHCIDGRVLHKLTEILVLVQTQKGAQFAPYLPFVDTLNIDSKHLVFCEPVTDKKLWSMHRESFSPITLIK